MAKVFIYSGIPGAGKTSMIRIRHTGDSPGPFIYSTDDFFLMDGVYHYVREKQDEAHLWNLRRFLQHIYTGSNSQNVPGPAIIVDNVNATAEHMAPYAQAARAFGHELQIVTLIANPFFAHARNVHGVPFDSVVRMAEQIKNRVLPSVWPEERINVT